MAKEEKKPEGMEIKVEVEENARRGEYSNFVRIQHTAMDFRFDFARALPDENTLLVHTRLFMSPIHAKMFLRAIEDNVSKYEMQFGTIEINVGDPGAMHVSGSRTAH